MLASWLRSRNSANRTHVSVGTGSGASDSDDRQGIGARTHEDQLRSARIRGGDSAVQCLTYKECAAWCREHDYPVVDSGHNGRPSPMVREHFQSIPVAYPQDSGKKVELSRAVIQWMSSSGALLLWLDEWAVWPSSQHMPLFMRFRAALGEQRPLIEAPGHLFSHEELDDAVSVLATSMLFFWDCHVFAEGPSQAFFCSHDEWNTFMLPEGADSSGVETAFANWSIRE